MNIVILASGNGTNLQAIISAVNSSCLKARIAIVISDNKRAFALERAKRAGIECLFIDPKSFKSKKDFDREIVRNLKKRKVKLVCLAGYMRLLTPYFVKAYKNRIINVHPALLPSFKGANGVKDALDYGVKITGPTVHFVTVEVDAGPIIMQSAVPVEDDDTEDSLRERIHKEEHSIYPKAIKYFVEGRIKIKGRKVIVKERREE